MINLHVEIYRKYLSMEESYNLFTTILEETNWYRVQYKSEQYKHDCETPCWTNFYGGISDIDAPS